MTKVMDCREVSFDREGVIRAETEKEATKLVTEQAKEVLGIQKVLPEVVEKILSVARDE